MDDEKLKRWLGPLRGPGETRTGVAGPFLVASIAATDSDGASQFGDLRIGGMWNLKENRKIILYTIP